MLLFNISKLLIMENIQLSGGKELEGRINDAKNIVENLNTDDKSKENLGVSKLNKKLVNIIMSYESISEEDVYSKFSNNEELNKYIKDKGYKEKRKSKNKTFLSEDERTELLKRNADALNKIEDIIYDAAMQDSVKLEKIKEIYENRNKANQAEITKKNKIVERFAISRRIQIYKEKTERLRQQYDVLNKEIENLDNIIKGN